MRRSIRTSVSICLLNVIASMAHGAILPDEPFHNYYTIRDSSSFAAKSFAEPVELMISSVAAQVVDLLQLEFHGSSYPRPQAPYNRAQHFGSWVNDPRDDECYNTRAKVLIRDSKVPVTMSPRNKCSVASGKWTDLYSGRTLSESTEVEIDHVVALKNAYISGGHRWNWLGRCLYANSLSNPSHLLTVEKTENRRKSDRTPADWMPSDRRAHCTHLVNWMRIKLFWGLVLSEREAKAIQMFARDLQCNPGWFKVTSAQVAQQRRLIQQNMDLCRNVRPGEPTEERRLQ